jgi:hypothetical protein
MCSAASQMTIGGLSGFPGASIQSGHDRSRRVESSKFSDIGFGKAI